MYKNLPPLTEEKLLPKNFGSIGHLTGSKMIDDKDKLLNVEQQEKYTVCKRDINDIVIVTEKIDGMNAGVIKKNGFLYPINRKGYDTRNMGKTQEYLSLLGKEWANWVDNHYHIYDSILEEGERLVFENAILKHTLEYRFKSDPVFLLAKYRPDNKRINYEDLCKLARTNNLNQPPLLNKGVAISPELIISQYPKGVIGVKGQIEGVVYSYEHNGKHESCAKYVSNNLMGTIIPRPQFYNKIIKLA